MCGVMDIIEPIVAVAASAVLGPEVGLGLEGIAGGAFAGEATIGGALVGAGLGAAGSAITGGNPLMGALTGGVGGAIGPNIGDIIGGAQDAVGLGSTPTPTGGAAADTAATGAGGAPTVANAAANTATSSGSFVDPSGASNLASKNIQSFLSPEGLTGSSLSDTTHLGDLSFAGEPSVDTSNLGPINSTPTLGASASGGDLGAGAGGSATPSIGGPNIGQGPTVANAAALPAQTPAQLATAEGPMSRIGDAFTDPKNLPSLLGAGFTGLQALQGPPPLPSSAKPLLANGEVTAPLIANENLNLNAANTGQVTPGNQASISQYTQNARNQLLQQLASSGVTNPQQDTRYVQGMQQIQQQAQIMTQQAIQQEFTQAMSSAGAASTNLTNAANMQTQSDNAFTTALSSATASIGGMAALSNLTKKAA